MKINYWILFAIIAGCVFIAIIIIGLIDKDPKVKVKPWDYLSAWFFLGIPFAGILCWIISFIAGTVYYIENGNKYSDTDYLLWYTSPRGETHFMAPFCTYIDNNASEDVIIKTYGYGNCMNDYFPVYYYAPKTVSRIKKIPDFYFESAPNSIRTKGSGGERTVMNYASEFKNEY